MISSPRHEPEVILAIAHELAGEVATWLRGAGFTDHEIAIISRAAEIDALVHSLDLGGVSRK